MVLGEAPSAPLAAKNNSIARPKLSWERSVSGAHAPGSHESGGHKSDVSDALATIRPPWRGLKSGQTLPAVVWSRARVPHLVVWLGRKDSNLRSPDPESVPARAQRSRLSVQSFRRRPDLAPISERSGVRAGVRT